jgi:hypothetical protein
VDLWWVYLTYGERNLNQSQWYVNYINYFS